MASDVTPLLQIHDGIRETIRRGSVKGYFVRVFALHRMEIICVGPCADPKSLFLTIPPPESYTPQTSSPCFHYSSFAGPLQTPTLSFLSFTLFRRFLTNSPQSCLLRPKSRAAFSPRYPSTTTSHHITPHQYDGPKPRDAATSLFYVLLRQLVYGSGTL